MNTFELNRRQALIVGGMGALSLGMPGMVMGSDKLDASGKAVAAEKSCIFVLLCGGPSHVDTWDMKPDAPDTIRGPYQPIATKVPGMRINEMHTELAKLTDQFTLINSMTHPGAISNHFDAMHNLLSGQSAKRVQRGRARRPALPRLVRRQAQAEQTQHRLQRVAHQVRRATGLLRAEHRHRRLPRLGLRAGVRRLGQESSGDGQFQAAGDLRPRRPDRLAKRRELLGSIESNALAKDARGTDWSDLREKAYDAMTRPEGREAFNLDREPAKVRDRYGRHPLGQNLLLARRMVEAGVRFVTVNGWTGQAPHDTAGPPSSSWDMHGGNMGMGNAFGDGSYGMGFCLPRLDQALSALLSDLKERGMLNNTLVVVTGEFGRTPNVLTQQPPGRQHWPSCFSSILAGAGIAGGQVYGKSDKHGAYVTSNPVRPEELAATIYHALDIPLNEPQNNSGISRPSPRANR